MKKIIIPAFAIIIVMVSCGHPDTSNVPAGKDSLRAVAPAVDTNYPATTTDTSKH